VAHLKNKHACHPHDKGAQVCHRATTNCSFEVHKHVINDIWKEDVDPCVVERLTKRRLDRPRPARLCAMHEPNSHASSPVRRLLDATNDSQHRVQAHHHLPRSIIILCSPPCLSLASTSSSTPLCHTPVHIHHTQPQTPSLAHPADEERASDGEYGRPGMKEDLRSEITDKRCRRPARRAGAQTEKGCLLEHHKLSPLCGGGRSMRIAHAACPRRSGALLHTRGKS